MFICLYSLCLYVLIVVDVHFVIGYVPSILLYHKHFMSFVIIMVKFMEMYNLIKFHLLRNRKTALSVTSAFHFTDFSLAKSSHEIGIPFIFGIIMDGILNGMLSELEDFYQLLVVLFIWLI